MKDDKTIIEKDLAYGGQALIEGVLMRGQKSYAFTVKQPDAVYYKEKHDYIPIGKRFKFLGLPLIRGIVGLFENLALGMKILNKSAEIAYPEEKNESTSSWAMFLIFLISIIFIFGIFGMMPYFLASLFKLSHNNNPILYNFTAGIIRLMMFFIYVFSISFLKDTKRLFGYHGAEHKTIHTYEAKEELSLENVKKFSRLHPRCGTSFVFIVFLITLVVFPLFNLYFNQQSWYTALTDYKTLGNIIQKMIHVFSHLLIGMPIVAAISYELLKLSGKYHKNPLVKIFISPGLFFQLFTTREPDEDMIKAAIYSLKMVLGEEFVETKRLQTDNISSNIPNILTTVIFFPLFLFSVDQILNN